MTVHTLIKSVLWYLQIACYLLILVIGAFVTVANDATGQTLPQIVIKKVTQPATDDSTEFTFFPNDLLGGKEFVLKNGESHDFDFVPDGPGYAVTEHVPSAWILVSATCDNGNDPTENIVVQAGKTATCTFVNQKKGNLIIRKITDPAPDPVTEFSFTAGGGLTPAQFTLKDDTTVAYNDIVPGAGYSIAELLPAGWVQTSASCSNGSPVTNITVDPGETVTCTFVNTRLGQLIVRKVTDPDPDPTQRSFAFVAGGGLLPGTFVLKNGGEKVFDNLMPRAGYTVVELTLDDWQLSDTTCTDNSPNTNIDIDPGETVICTFTNKNTAVGLTLTKSTTAEKAIPGQPLNYNLAYFNGGPLNASNVLLTEKIPDYTTYIGANGWDCTPDNDAGATCVYALGTVANGAGGQVEFLVQVDASVPAGVTAIKNRATIGTATLAEIDDGSETTELTAAPDLQLSKTDNGQVAPGSVIVYALTYKNGGNQAATGVVLTETLPEHTTFDSNSSSSGWTCTGTNCRFVVGGLAAGAQATVNFAVKVTTSPPAGVTAIVNTATITDDGANGADPTPANNQATATTTLNRIFQVVVTKRDTLLLDADNDSVPSPGDTLEYVITVRSNSNLTARNVTFTDTLDPNTELVPGVQSGQGLVTVGNKVGDTRVEVALGNLAGNGATVTIRFQAHVKLALPPAVTSVQNQAVVSSIDFADVKSDDPDSDASGDATRTALRAFAQLQATLVDYLFVDSDGNEVVSVGDILIYRLTLVNNGNGAAGGITITDPPDVGLQLISGSVATGLGEVVQGNGAGDATLQVDVPLLPANESMLVSYQMRIVAGAQNTVATQATLAVQTGLANNSASLTTDDPDVAGETDPTVTPLGRSLAKLQMSFLPIIATR